MFSGIVQGTREVVAVTRGEGSMSLSLALGDLALGLQKGASVSLAGVCLTVVSVEGDVALFEIMGETLAKTTLGALNAGALVNIERSVKVGDEIGGHRVSGHVTGTAAISRIETPPNNRIVTLACDPTWMDFILRKGFVALDGCSLTVVDIGKDWFTVHLIPETLRLTAFGLKKIGEHVNVELDPETVAIVTTVKRIIIPPVYEV